MQAGQVWDAVAQPELSPHQLFKRFRAGSATPHELAKVLRNNQGMQNTIKVSALDAYTEATPPCMTRMSEDERVETLAVLMKNKEVGYQELAKLPMTVETPSLRRRKADLERKLEQIDDAIKIFSRECVWVQEDA